MELILQKEAKKLFKYNVLEKCIVRGIEVDGREVFHVHFEDKNQNEFALASYRKMDEIRTFKGFERALNMVREIGFEQFYVELKR